MAFEPIEFGSAEVVAPPRGGSSGPRTRRCNPQVREFMRRVVRELSSKPMDSSLEVPVSSFSRIGLKSNQYQIISALDACPESEYVKIEPTDDHIKITKVGQPDVKVVKHYTPRLRQED
jgi:hypothetical protein